MTHTISDIMDGLAGSAATVTQNVYAYPVDEVTVPCVIVGYPETIDYDSAFGRGGDVWHFPVWYVVGKSMTASARDALSAAIEGSPSIKSTLDGAQSYGDVRVTTATIELVHVGTVEYLSVKFSVEVV